MSLMRHFKDFLSYNRAERNGIKALLAVLLLIWLLRALLPEGKKVLQTNPEKYFSIIDSIENAAPRKKVIIPKKRDQVQLFDFNPNQLPESEWLKLGLSENQVRVIKNFEKAGGTFKHKKDLGKIYVINDSLYHALEKHIKIPEAAIKPKPQFQERKEPAGLFDSNALMPSIVKNARVCETNIELNAADTGQLTQLNGIGEVFAGRIIKYRTLLGGFYCKEQLLEVYGFSKETLNLIWDYVDADTALINKIDINTAEFKNLSNHPYIGYNLTKTIVNSRDHKGYFLSFDDFIKKVNPDSALAVKLRPYLTFSK